MNLLDIPLAIALLLGQPSLPDPVAGTPPTPPSAPTATSIKDAPASASGAPTRHDRLPMTTCSPSPSPASNGRTTTSLPRGSSGSVTRPSSPRRSSSAREQLERLVALEAKRQGLELSVVRSVITHESGWRVLARSGSGALGLMQVMPFHFRAGQDWRDPVVNIRVGCHVLKGYYLRAGGDWSRALAMYNAGPGGASRGLGWGYARSVMRGASPR